MTEKFKLVPVEPTPEMLKAGAKEVDWYDHNASDCYRAMLAAAPDAPATELVAFEMDWPDYHPEAMGCGLEDQNISDRYEAMRYGWDEAIERCAERLPEELYTHAPDALGPIQQQFEMVSQDRDGWIDCHAKIFRELQEAKTLLGNKCAEVERLTRERDEWKERAESSPLCEEVVDILRSQLAAAQRDAVRAYKSLSTVFTHWMEDSAPDELEGIVEEARNTLCDLTLRLPIEAIDAAMSGKEGEK